MKLIQKIKDWLFMRWLRNDECPYTEECREQFYENCDNFDDCMQNYAESRGP